MYMSGNSKTVGISSSEGLSTSSDNYENEAIVSLDNLFVPFTTHIPDGQSSELPRMTTPTVDGQNSDRLRPMPDGYAKPPTVMSFGKEVPNEDIFPDINNPVASAYRGFAHAAPMMLAGYGQDVDGNPVPSESRSGGIAGLFGINTGSGYDDGTYLKMPVVYNNDSGDGALPYSGYGATFDIVVVNGYVSTFTLNDTGYGYSSGDQLTCILPNGSGFLVEVTSTASYPHYPDTLLTDKSNHKVGPLDVYWDETRGVWTTKNVSDSIDLNYIVAHVLDIVLRELTKYGYRTDYGFNNVKITTDTTPGYLYVENGTLYYQYGNVFTVPIGTPPQ